MNRNWKLLPIRQVGTLRTLAIILLMALPAKAIPNGGRLTVHRPGMLGASSENLQIAIITAQTRNPAEFNDDMAPERKDFLHLSPDYANLFIQNKKDWAAYQSYDYVHTVIEADESAEDMSREMVERSIHWVKIDLLQKYLSRYDWLCWLDMDAIVVDTTVKLETYMTTALRHRPQTNLIIEGSEDYKKLDGNAIKSGVIMVRNSVWTRRFLAQLKEILADPEWQKVLDDTMLKKSSSFLDNAITFLLNSDHYAEPHVYFMNLQDRWDQRLVYLPKIGILHFSGCTDNDAKCIDVFDRAVTHMLRKEQMYVYLAAPFIQHIYHVFVVVYVIFALDRAWHIIGRYFWPSRLSKYKKATLPNAGQSDELYPMVAVQLPMYNETSCCQTIIDAVCQLDWPKSRFFVQVVDDSTSEETRQFIDERASIWRSKGVNIDVLRRTHRSGFKAGAMNEAMEHFVPGTEFIAIFDADFLPQPLFLRQTVPYLSGNSKVAFVQTRWIYTNAKESLLTRMQEIALNFHFLCEQEVRFRMKRFFNFNGTAGVWRKSALDDCGGWHTDTLVEDMDLSLRAWAKGWEFIYLKDVKVLNEIPPTFGAYRGQQHRWTSGPMQVLKKAFRTIFSSNRLSVVDKLFCLWFFLRNYIHIVNFLYFLILIPLMIWIPRVHIYEWAVVYLPAAISMTNVFFTPNETFRIIHYVLFENAMCLYKTGALICGVLNIGKAKQWIVTPKFARKKLAEEDSLELDERDDSLKISITTSASMNSSNFSLDSIITHVSDDGLSKETVNTEKLEKGRKKSFGKADRFINITTAYQLLRPTLTLHANEIIMSIFLFVCAYFGFLMRQYGIASFSLLNAFSYSIVGISWLGRSG